LRDWKQPSDIRHIIENKFWKHSAGKMFVCARVWFSLLCFTLRHKSYISNFVYRICNKQTNSVALSPRANYTDWATATCRRNLMSTLWIEGCRVVSASDPLRSLISVSRPEPLLFFQVAPHLLSQGLSGPRTRSTATQKIW
jgi:hypothetical protein